MKNKLKIFYIVDLLIIIISVVLMIIENNKNTYGLNALASTGIFVIFLGIFVVAVSLFIIISIINICIYCYKKLKG